MILVTGATGNLGRATINALLNNGIKPQDISALVRDEAKGADFKLKGIQVKLGNYDDVESLKRAFQGVNKLLLVSSSSDIVHRYDQHKNVIDAATATGISHIVYTSFDMKDLRESTMAGDVQYHALTTDYLRQVAIPYTSMNNTLYADMVPMIGGKDILKNGISIPAGLGKVPFLPITEMAETLAIVLTTPGHTNKKYVIAAENAFSFAEIAEMMSEITGTRIPYNQIEVSSYVSQLVQQGVSEDDARYLARFAKAISIGEFETNKSDVKYLLGRNAISLKAFLEKLYIK